MILDSPIQTLVQCQTIGGDAAQMSNKKRQPIDFPLAAVVAGALDIRARVATGHVDPAEPPTLRAPHLRQPVLGIPVAVNGRFATFIDSEELRAGWLASVPEALDRGLEGALRGSCWKPLLTRAVLPLNGGREPKTPP